MTGRIPPLVMARALWVAAGAVAGYLAFSATATPATAPGLPQLDGPAIWLVETLPGVTPSVRVLDDFSAPGDCYRAWAAWRDTSPAPGTYAACVPLDATADLALAIYGAHENGLIEGDF